MRLITFGCSFTQGIGLDGGGFMDHQYYRSPQDAILYIKPASEHAWPLLLAEKLNLECINLGRGGSSPKFVFQMIKEFQFQPSDTVIIQWPNSHRKVVWANESDIDGGGPWQTGNYTPHNPKIYTEISPHYQGMDDYYRKYNTDFDNLWELGLLIEGAHNYLKDICKVVYSVSEENELRNNELLPRFFPILKEVKPFFKDQPEDLNIPKSEILLNKDQLIICNDQHPGRQFHIDFVEDMFKELKSH